MRMFVGIKIDVSELLSAVKKRIIVAGNTKIKWVLKDNLHLTFVFVGPVGDSQFFMLKDVLQKELKDTSSFYIKTGKIGCFNKGKGRGVLWLGVQESQELYSLQKLISDVCTSVIPDFEMQYNDYRPHISLARYSGKLNFNEDIKMNKSLDINVDEIQIIESLSGVSGMKYKVKEKIIL